MTLAPTPRPTRFPLHTAQADLITRSHGSIRRLLDAFDPEGKGISKAGLVINLLRSQGTIADTYGKCESGGSKPGDYLGNGRVRPPILLQVTRNLTRHKVVVWCVSLCTGFSHG